MKNSSAASPLSPPPARPARATAFAYDDVHARHTLRGHPEHAGRLAPALALLEATGLLAEVQRVPVRPATPADIARVHSGALLAQLERARQAARPTRIDQDTYLTPGSHAAALSAAGGVIQVVQAVLDGRATNGLALARPPGHHATPARAMGFCLLNNVAIAARWAQATMGVERILIFDFDVHHGNGTQDVFYRDASVLFVSVHQYPLYPMTGRLEETGAGAGLGFTCNLPLPPGAGDAGYRQVAERIAAPLAEKFRPELILVSAGFDGHWQDPLSHMNLTLSGYDYLMRFLMALARSACAQRLVVALEGGYELAVLRCAVHNTLQTLAGRAQFQDPFGASGIPDAAIDDMLARAGALWGVR